MRIRKDATWTLLAGGDSPTGALAQRMRELVVAKSWADLLPQLELSKTLQGIVADMGVEPEATVESVVMESARACSYYSVRIGMQIGHPPGVQVLALPTLPVAMY